MKYGWRLAVAFLAVALLAPGCAELQPAVNRVGNDVLEKSAFQGEWYYLQTVIDTPYSVPYTFVGEQSLLERIEWEIQEDLLIARRSYEFVSGSEGEGIAGAASERGVPIAIFRIDAHFDIRRTFNTVTGEQENVVVEAEDRPWHLRRYMRVDWSTNLVSEGEFLSYARVFDGIEVESVAYHINDPAHPDAPTFGWDEDGVVDYFDIVNRVLVRPTTIDFDGESFPTCWLEYQTHTDCAPAELSIRRSYLRVDTEARDYQPQDYSGDRMERFGFFVTERPGYDPHYGPVEPARSRWINRHNIWQQSHRRDADGALVACTQDEDCGDQLGSVCDGDLARARGTTEGACTIPYRERETRPIVYHVSERFPEDLLTTARVVASEWSDTFAQTVASLRETECLTAGGSADLCAEQRARPDASPMFILCSNPVVEDDHEACGEPGTVARIGDLRYSLLAWVPEPHAGSPLGYGPASADPVTGELIQANAFMYGAGIEELAAYGRDLVAVLNGDVDESTIANGDDIERWVARTAGAGGRTIPMTGRDAARIEQAMDLSRVTGGRRPGGRARAGDRRELRSAAVRSLSRRGAFGNAASARARIDTLRGTPIESMLLSPDLNAAGGIDPDLPSDETLLELASPLRGMSLSRRRAVARARRHLMRERCVVRAADFGDDGLLGLARAIRDAANGPGTMEWYGQTFDLNDGGSGIDYEAVRKMLRHPIMHSTSAHEVGHTLGLRHNFAGSSDALNYGPGYWALRNDGDVRARPWDPITDAEIDGRERELQYATVMDYGNNFVVTDAGGLGHYDYAAIKMGYGDLVEVFTQAADPAELGWVYFSQLFGWPGPFTRDSFLDGNPIRTHHYTDLPNLAGGIAALEQRADVPYASLVAEPTLDAEDGIDMPLADAQGRPAVPYRFCSDELADLSPDCMLYDAGADDYESLQSIIDTYWSYYVFNNYRRERLGFDTWSHWDSVYYRYFSKLQYANQTYVFNRAFVSEIFGDDLGDFFEREDGFGVSTLAVGAAFSLLTRVVTTPEPGGYVTYPMADGTDALLLDELFEPEVTVDPLEGRYLETAWDFDAGYYWFDQLSRVGYFIDKVLALQVLVDPETSFLGQDTEADVRGFAINFASSFPEATSALLAGVLAEDFTQISPRMRPDNTLAYPDPLQLIDGSMPGVPVDPNTDFSVQIWAAAMGMALIPATFDDLYFEQSRIWIDGSTEAIVIPDIERVTFVDPFTSLTYVATTYPDAGGAEAGQGARMLNHATDLEASGDYFALDNYLDLVRYARSLSWYYGHGP